MRFTRRFVLGALSASLLPVPAAIAQSDPLPSWNEGAADWKKVFAFEL